MQLIEASYFEKTEECVSGRVVIVLREFEVHHGPSPVFIPVGAGNLLNFCCTLLTTVLIPSIVSPPNCKKSIDSSCTC